MVYLRDGGERGEGKKSREKCVEELLVLWAIGAQCCSGFLGYVTKYTSELSHLRVHQLSAVTG